MKKKLALVAITAGLTTVTDYTALASMWDMTVGGTSEYSRSNATSSWSMTASVIGTQSINNSTYYVVDRYNYDNDNQISKMYVRSNDSQIYFSDGANEFLFFDRTWSIGQTNNSIDGEHQRLLSYDSASNVYVIQQWKTFNNNINSPFWYEYVSPGFGVVQEIDYWTTNAPATSRLDSFTFAAPPPVLPAAGINNSGSSFNFTITDPQEPIFIDPIVATGYDYSIIGTGPSFASVLLPVMGDNEYEIWLKNGSSWIKQDNLQGGSAYNFGGTGVNNFRITGIDISLGLDPNDPLAFITGLTFTGAGSINMTQVPLTYDTDPVPEPATILLFGAGIAGLAASRRKKKAC